MDGGPALVVAAKDSESLFSDSGIAIALGGGAGALAILGLLLLVPLYVSHRREVARLIDWKDREPEAGTTEFRAVPGPEAASTGSSTRTGGAMTPAERVTSERPALARITTAEHEALELERAPFWRRVVERGPRHPLVLMILALLVGGAIFAAAGLLIRSGNEESDGPEGSIDPGTVRVVVLNAASSSGVAGDIAAMLEADGFDVVETTVATESIKESSVQFADGAKREGRAVARSLRDVELRSFDAEAEAAAGDADVVVIAGRDATSTSSSESNSGGQG